MTPGTPRLVLEPLRPTDRDALLAHWREPEVRRYLWDGRVAEAGEVEAVIRASERLFAERCAGLWAVRPRGAADLIGCAGFWEFHEPPETEFLISLSAAHHGKGLARECVGALLDHAFGALGWPAVQGSADAPNEASLRMMRGLGMEPAGQRPGAFGAIEVFRITREAWQGRAAAGPAPLPA